MVLRRPSARSREGLNDGHRRTSAGEQSRTPGLEHPLHVEQCRLLTRLDGRIAVVVGQKPHRQIAHPIIVDELRPAQTAPQ